jgi:hypothetical protein
MALQFSVTDRTGFASELAGALSGGTIKFFFGLEAANCAAADPLGLLASGTLPAPAATAAAGVMTKAGTWTATGSTAGTAASFRIYDTSAVCRIQGTLTATGGGGDMTVDNPSIAVAQVITVATFAVTFGNA